MNLAKSKKRTVKKIRKANKKQLQYVKHNLGYVEIFLAQEDVELSEKQTDRLNVLCELYEHQKHMYENNVHSVKDRSVSINQPYIRLALHSEGPKSSQTMRRNRRMRIIQIGLKWNVALAL